MIPLIAFTPRLTLLAASRALLIAELDKPHYFPMLLGAAMPLHWPPGEYDEEAMRYFLEKLTAGGRDAAGWYAWYAILRAGDEVATNTLIGTGGFHGPPSPDGTVEIGFSIAEDWQGRGLGRELAAGLVEHAAQTGMVHHLVARTTPENVASQKILVQNGFEANDLDFEGYLHFGRPIEPAAPSQ